MKILIAADMEGVGGVTNWDQVTPGHFEYPRFRQLMTAEVNAAIQGAVQSGADQIIVADGHDLGSNILIEELDPRARLNTGSPSPFAMVQGIQDGADGVFFIGYHARAGSTNAILDHTWSSSRVANVWLNDQGVGEIGLNAAVCGSFGAPVVMVSGDQTACGEARALLGDLDVAVVKQAAGRRAAQCLPPEIARERICEAASRAVQRLAAHRAGGSGIDLAPPPAPFRVAEPVELKIEFLASQNADQASLLPACKRLDGRRVSIQAPDMPTAYHLFRAAVQLA